MKQIQIKGIRSIDDSGKIDLNRCNFIIGANGTGKSTILRIFPLIKQTILRKSNAPLLWYDKDGVDFGSYKDTISKSKKVNNIELLFSINEVIKISKELISDLLLWEGSRRYLFVTDDQYTSVKVKDVSFSIVDETFSNLTISFDDNWIVFDFKANQLKVNEATIDLEGLDLEFTNLEYSLLPKIYVKSEVRKNIEKWCLDKIKDNLFEKTHKNIKETTKKKFLRKINYTENYEKILDDLSKSKTPKSIVSQLKTSENKRTLWSYILILYASNLIDPINEILSNFFKEIIYVAPIRATAERFYRIQGLSVSEVDSRGNNVPMILDDLRQSGRETEWQKWTMDNFGTKYMVETVGFNTSVKVYIDGEYYNLADTGFGYSQILPILLMIWQEQAKSNDEKNNTSINFFAPSSFIVNEEQQKLVVIEQPELHLHPNMQGQFAELIFKIVQSENSSINFLIETHSTVIINKIGELIEQYNQEYNSNIEDKFNLYLVNRGGEEKITKTQYDESGIIDKWPIGFL